MAIEALSQIKNLNENPDINAFFTFRNVNILSALVVRHDDNDSELFTTMYAEKISTASTSGIWYDFSISSHQAGISTQHCVGSISLGNSPAVAQGSVQVSSEDYDVWTMGRWYEKLAEGGLCFGPAFQSLTSIRTEKARKKPEAVSTTTLRQRVKMTPTSQYAGTLYPVHPLTIDSCLQAAIMGGTAGNIDTLKAYLPVFISYCRINRPLPGLVGLEAFIHSRSQITGFGTKTIDVTLRDHSNNVVVDISNARLALYKGMIETEESAAYERHPCLRVVWKPDVARIDAASQPHLESYLREFIDSHQELADSRTTAVAAGLIDLIGHKNPRFRTLELGGDCDCKSRQWLKILDSKSAFTRCREYQVGRFTNDGQLFVARALSPGKAEEVPFDFSTANLYDLLILSNVRTRP